MISHVNEFQVLSLLCTIWEYHAHNKAGVSRTLEVLIVEERLNDRNRKILKVHPTHDAMFHHVNYHKCSSHFTK